MKKLLLIPVMGILLASCGGEEEKKEEWDVCKCHVEMDKVEQEMREGGGSDDLKDRAMKIVSKCDKIQDEMGMEKFMEAKEGCLNK